jgi:type II secretory pathway predicted ATPase ExeA
MYNAYFSFREAPFGVTPDPRFYYDNVVYQETYATLRYGVEARKGFIVITGEAGTGKTTLLRKALGAFDSKVKTAYIPYTLFNHTELLPLILTDLGLQTSENRSEMVRNFTKYLVEQFESGNIVALLVDEAQNLSLDSLEELRCLGNLETDRDKLLQIVLAGQIELEQKLDQASLRQLKQRVALRCRIKPLTRGEVKFYMDARMQVIGHSSENVFDPDAIEKIAFYSTGIPRLINIICDNALLLAYAHSERKVSASMVEEAVEDLHVGASVKQKSHAQPLVKPLEEKGVIPFSPAFLNDVNQRSANMQQKAKEEPLVDDSNDDPLTTHNEAAFSNKDNRDEAPARIEAFTSRHRFKSIIASSAAIVLLIGSAVFLYPPEWRSLLLGFHSNIFGDKNVKKGELVLAAVGAKASATIPQATLPGPDNQPLSTPDQNGAATRTEEPTNAPLAVAATPEVPTPAPADPKKSQQALPDNRQNISSNRANLLVTGPSFVRSKPTANADIVATLLPGTRIQVTARMGEYYGVRSLDPDAIRGYVHKEDAFFGSTR